MDNKFSTGEECAEAAMEKPKAKGATYNNGECWYITDTVVAGGTKYTDYDCYVFSG